VARAGAEVPQGCDCNEGLWLDPGGKLCTPYLYVSSRSKVGVESGPMSLSLRPAAVANFSSKPYDHPCVLEQAHQSERHRHLQGVGRAFFPSGQALSRHDP